MPGSHAIATNLQRQSAFTLPELLVAVAVSVLALAMVMSVLAGTLGVWRDGLARLHLSRRSRLARETILRGMAGGYGLRHARRESVGAVTNGLAFEDGSNLFALVAASNQPLLYWSPAGGWQPAGAADIAGSRLEWRLPNPRTVVLDLELRLASGGRTYVQPQRLSVDLLNE